MLLYIAYAAAAVKCISIDGSFNHGMSKQFKDIHDCINAQLTTSVFGRKALQQPRSRTFRITASYRI